MKLGSIDKALPHAGFYPDSQNKYSDDAKIDIISESSKYFSDYFKFLGRNRFIIEIFSYLCTVRMSSEGAKQLFS